jgi:hypothetical protein
MGLLDNINASATEDIIGTAILGLKKQFGKEAFESGYKEVIDQIDKLPEDKTLTFAKINGKVSIILSDKDSLEFKKQPIFVNIQEIVEDNL